MFEVDSKQLETISPVTRRLQSAAKGVKRTFEERLSPVKKRQRLVGSFGEKKRKFQDDHSPIQLVKRQKVGNQNLGEEGLVKSRVWGVARRSHPLSHPLSQVKDLPSTSLVKRQRVGKKTIPSHMNDENFGEEQLVKRRAQRFARIRNIPVALAHPPSKVDEVSPRSPTNSLVQNPQRVDHSPIPHPPPQTLPYVPPAAISAANFCHSCNHRFPSYEALEYHQNLKMRSLKKCKILTSRFTPDLHLAICPIRTCCSTFAKVEEMREHLLLRHRQAGKQYLVGREKTLDEIYVILKHSAGEKGIISCPACQKTFNNSSNLLRHQTKSCRGYGQYNCVICSKHFRDRKQMMNHMKTAHPPPPGVRITGMFLGKQKDRKGVRSERSIGGREILSQFSFIPDQPIVTTAGEFFSPTITEGMTWLIQRARSSGGNSIIRLNVSSLVRRGESRNLIPFETQAKLLNFSASASPKSIISR